MNPRIKKPTRSISDRKSERGAALVTVMMISFLLLVASIALILESTMNTANVSDATAEEQAYYAAESGVQSVIDTLRHNAVPSPSVDPAATPLPSGVPNIINRLDYRKAVNPAYSNKTCDPDDTPPYGCADPRDNNVARLSRWMPYNWGPNLGTGDPSPDRVVLGDPATYSPLNGFAYSVEVSDPDNTSGNLSFTTTGYLSDSTGAQVASMTFPGAGTNESTTIQYIPPGPQTVDVGGEETPNIGEFVMTNGSAGPGIIPGFDAMIRFKIILLFSQPAGESVVIRGYILPPSATPIQNTDSTTCARPTLSYLFASKNFRNFGSLQSITNGGCEVQESPSNSPQGPNETFLTGWQVQPGSSGTHVQIGLSISQPEPRRLLIRSVGYGPRGSRKQLESIIQKNYFDGLGAPSPLTLIGPTCTKTIAGTCTVRNGIPAGVTGVTTGQTPESQIVFTPGTSNPIQYTGRDASYSLFQPPIGVTNDVNLNYIRYVIANDFGGQVFGTPENIAAELPPWLRSPRNIERTIQLLREVAQASGTYYGANPPPNNTTFGDFATGTGITVIDHVDGADLNHFAGGLLVVTKRGVGLRGRYGFRGVMLITGPDGLFRFGGGGANCPLGEVCGRLQGNMIVAPYNAWSLNTCMPDTATPQFQDKLNCFLSPRYDINGGGKSELMGNEQDVASALTGLGNFVKGVVEK